MVLKFFFIIIIAILLARASRNLLLAAQKNPQKLSDQDSDRQHQEQGEDGRLSRHHAPHEVIEDAKWKDL